MSDLISRESTIKALLECGDHYNKKGNAEAGRGVAQCLSAVYDLPAVDIDLSGYSDRLWKEAYERGKAEGKNL